MFIEGIGISGFRSFGSEVQRIGPLKTINLLIGQNNSGKSNILLFLSKHYGEVIKAINQGASYRLAEPLDKHIGKYSSLKVEIGIKPDGHYIKNIMAQRGNDKTRLAPLIQKILESSAFNCQNDMVWIPYKIESDIRFTSQSPVVMRLAREGVLPAGEWQYLWSNLTGRINGSLEQNWIPEILNVITSGFPAPPDVALVPAVRQIEAESTGEEHDLSGLGLINRLALLQNPSYDQRHLRAHFDEINLFLRSVTGNDTAQLEIPYARDVILVHMEDKILPLSSLGTGIHEVIILAAAATVTQNQIMCIEEPELHLHPILQKKLVRYLQEKTNNQYFITTHSAHLLDTPEAAIFHIRHQNGQSVIEQASTTKDRSAICADLGYRASDILQANSLIWVEGPSDRIYLNHWISALAPELIEGVHYSIMFYGGRLLSHLTAEDPEITEFVSLRRLNRYIAILIDSDRTSAHAHINSTKRRIRDEFNKGPGFAWITKGREIENYIEPAVLEDAVKVVHSSAVKLAHTNQFDHCLYFSKQNGSIEERVDKVKVAHQVAKRPPNLNILDLSEMMNKTIEFIRSANDLLGD